MKTNYHTHTTFCDGKNTPEEMVNAAIEKGFDELGFSAHALYPFAASWHLGAAHFTEYVACIKALAKKYESKIKILTGFEVDYLPPFSVPDKAAYKALGADYIIAAVHYVPGAARMAALKMEQNAKMTSVDASSKEVQRGITEVFGGSGKNLVRAYYAQVRKMVSSCDFDILAHIDVVRRRNDDLHFFCEDDAWYKRELEHTARVVEHAAKEKHFLCEINSGGMARSGLNEPYPSNRFFELLLQKKHIQFVLSSDAHKAEHLDFAFDSIQFSEAAKGRICPRIDG
ncbi:MAG: hypothetical protein Ta2A_23070 [Treponemataceae bacterium]|nr:MAG: hypothetical protein Ta2A_23070 [Treponemataceae bacterium]